MPSLSVVVPSFNNAATIAQTLESILSQEGVDFEVVVSDHNSTDETWERLGAIDDPRLRVIRGPTERTAAANWNHVTAQATADLVRLVCADDRLAPGTLARHVDLFASAPSGTVMVTGPRDVVMPGGRILARARPARHVGPVDGRTAIARTARSGTNLYGEPFACTVRTDVLREAGGWGSRRGFLLDLETWTRMLERGDLWVDTELTGSFRVSADQWSARLASEQAVSFSEYLANLPHDQLGLTGFDLLVGRFRARLKALARRLVYGYVAWSHSREGAR